MKPFLRRALPTLMVAACCSLWAGSFHSAEEIRIPGSEARVKTWSENDRSGMAKDWYAISLDGRTWHQRQTSYVIKLRHGDFDPAGDLPTDPGVDNLRHGKDTHLYIVQFITQPLEDYRRTVRDLGGKVHQFLAQHAHLVRMDESTLAKVEALPFVRWVGPYHPGYRLEEPMLENLQAGNNRFGSLRYNIMLFFSEKVSKAMWPTASANWAATWSAITPANT